MKTQSGRKTTIKLQLWDSFRIPESEFDSVSKKLSNIAFSRKYAEKLIQSRNLREQKSKEAQQAIVEFFMGNEQNYGFKKPVGTAERITAHGGRNF